MSNETVKHIAAAFKDERGIIANIIEDQGDIRHVAIITSKPGCVRANHYHPIQWQYCYIIRGSYESYSKDLRVKDAPLQKIIAKTGDLVITPPMIAHAMKFLEDTEFLNITSGSRDAAHFGEHTIKYKLIDG